MLELTDGIEEQAAVAVAARYQLPINKEKQVRLAAAAPPMSEDPSN